MSKLETNTIDTISGSNTLTLGSSNLSTVNMASGVSPGTGMGKVLQVADIIQASSQQTIATTSNTDFTGFSINITPSSTSSKIFLFTTIAASTTINEGFGMNFMRDTTNIYSTTQPYAHYPQPNGGARLASSFQYTDAPSTINQITYKVQVRTHNSLSIVFNESRQSTFYLMEVAG